MESLLPYRDRSEVADDNPAVHGGSHHSGDPTQDIAASRVASNAALPRFAIRHGHLQQHTDWRPPHSADLSFFAAAGGWHLAVGAGKATLARAADSGSRPERGRRVALRSRLSFLFQCLCEAR